VFGYHGRYLRVDAGSGSSRSVSLEEGMLRAVLGGVGLGTALLAREAPAGIEPLAPAAALVIALSPLVGSPLTTSAKFAVVAMSPLTGRICDALSSSHFAIAAKRTGVDAIVIAGARPEPSLLFIDGLGRDEPEVTWHPAGSYLGLPASEAEGRLRADHGAEWQVAAIGPAGERLIPFATISHDGRHAGRGGLGAVLGSKRIKAIAVRGDRRTAPADPARTIELARDLSARSFGPATEKYRELGTVANLLVFNRFETLPTRNFQSGHFDGADRLATADLAPARRIARNSCAACTIGCEHVYERPKGGGVRLEYESLFALGPLCGVDDPTLVLQAASACDEAGLDTISTGGTLAFATECTERGWIDGRLPSGRRLRFGDGEAMVEAIGAIVEREGIGEWLALGSRRMAEKIGGEAPSIAPHVKGLELPGYDPRRLHAMALGLAVGTRGADHNRSGAYEADFSARIDRLDGGEASVLAAIETEDKSALMDSLILCKFVRGVFTDFHAEAAEMLRAVTGWDVTSDELRATSRRIVNSRKLVNIRAGWTRSEDTLPDRLLGGAGNPLTRERLDAMIAVYFRYRGWTDEGLVPVGR
jgi:aldehyde:ferredoxin oxidoreductase